MKTRFFLFAILAIITFSANAQDDYKNYLNKAMEKLDEGDCSSAQKFYNVYKDLSGRSISSVEVMIADCRKGPYKDSYNLGDKIKVDSSVYVVAYTRDNGKHGYAVLDQGWKGLTYDQFSQKQVPTITEMRLIYANRDIVRLYDTYWTCTREDNSTSTYMYVKDFSTAAENVHNRDRMNVARLLLIHRF